MFAVSLQDCRHVRKLGVIGGPALQDLLVQLDDGLGERFSEDFQEVWSLAAFSFTADQSLHNNVGEKLQEARQLFYDDQEDHSEPVEHVVHSGGGEGSLELLPVGHLSEADDGVGHARSDVGPHDHRYRRLYRDVGGHQPDNDCGGGGGGLDQDRHQHPDHHADHRVVQDSRVGEES